MGYEMKTKRGYDFFEVSSALQKAIRRGNEKVAGYFALELFASNFYNYAWKRLLTMSAEDIKGPVTKEILSLHQSFEMVNTPKKEKVGGRIFISKAVIILCREVKSRDADHLQNLVYDLNISLSENDIGKILEEEGRVKNRTIPEYAYDIHTRKGKKMKKTKKMFFLEENSSLFPEDNDPLFDSQLKEYLDNV